MLRRIAALPLIGRRVTRTDTPKKSTNGGDWVYTFPEGQRRMESESLVVFAAEPCARTERKKCDTDDLVGVAVAAVMPAFGGPGLNLGTASSFRAPGPATISNTGTSMVTAMWVKDASGTIRASTRREPRSAVALLRRATRSPTTRTSTS